MAQPFEEWYFFCWPRVGEQGKNQTLMYFWAKHRHIAQIYGLLFVDILMREQKSEVELNIYHVYYLKQIEY